MILWVNVYRNDDGYVSLGHTYFTRDEAVTVARGVQCATLLKTIAIDDAEGEMTERERYEVLSRALDVCATPDGHASGSYGKILDALVSMCPNVYIEEARKMQAGGYR
jgi:hypothetical protein